MRTLRAGSSIRWLIAITLTLAISNGCQSARPPEPVTPPTLARQPAPPTPVAQAPETSARTANHYEALANSPMRDNRPSAETVRSLADELLFQRATQVYLWAMPALNVLGMKNGSEKLFKAGYNVLPVWKKRIDAKTLLTTPNSDAIDAITYLDVEKEGPLVLEAPPGLQGILLDFWQRPLPGPPAPGKDYRGDIGFFGPDQGRGGKFLILPPGHKDRVPDGYFAFRAQTNNVFVCLRSFFKDPKDLAPAVALVESVKIYPLKAKTSPKPMQFPDASGIPANLLPANDGRAFEQLKQLVDSEGPEFAGADFRGLLAAIGIIKGQPFAPDAHTRTLLELAARTAYRASRALGFEERVGGVSSKAYPDRHWLNPMASGKRDTYDVDWNRIPDGYLALDARASFFANQYSLSPGTAFPVAGKGARSLMVSVDSSGLPLAGSANYRIKMPPNVPAANFWSLTLYEAENSSALANGRPFPTLGSREHPARKADGSIELYFGPSAPTGQESNWLATVPGKGYFAILRLYTPLEPALDGSWKPGDFEKLR
jgi:hypothetical protein